MTTLGDVQLRLSKLPHGAGVDKIVLLGIVNDVYQRFLGAYTWSRLVKNSTLQTTAIYNTGTVAVSNGGTTLTGTDTVWTAAMTGRMIRIGGRNEAYVFTRVTDTTATIERAYEGDDETAAPYTIFQTVYALPTDADLIESIRVPGANDDLDQKSAEYLDQLAAARWTIGRPELYTLAPDVTVGGVQCRAIELYPVPEFSEGLTIRYQQFVALFTSTSDTFLPWVSIECIIAGCEAELYAVKGNLPMYQVKAAVFQAMLRDAIGSDSDASYPDYLLMDERYTWHRTARALGHDYFSRRWWQLRNSNG